MEKVRACVEEFYSRGQMTGMTVAVTDREGLLGVYSFGQDNAEEGILAKNNALYRIASITKMFLGSVILKLVEEGKLNLDMPVCEYLPQLSFSKTGVEKEITLAHLLSHTSGLPMEYTPDGEREESALEEVLLRSIPTLELLWKPSENRYCYSNWGIRLASLIAEKVTGEKFSALARKIVLSPLGMERATFDVRVACTYPMSLPHEEGKVVHYISENATRYAAGGLFSNGEELCKFARFLLNDGVNDNGERILSKESLVLMRTPRTRFSDKEEYGLTMMKRETENGTLYGHLGSAPPYASSLFVCPEKGVGVVTLMNSDKKQWRTEIPEAVLKALIG